MRQYITYTRLVNMGGHRIDPQLLMNERWGQVFTFRETWANGNHMDDPRFIAIIDYDESVQDKVDKCIELDGLFEFYKVSEQWVIEKMNLWYGEGNWDFDDNNIFKDLRPVDELI